MTGVVRSSAWDLAVECVDPRRSTRASPPRSSGSDGWGSSAGSRPSSRASDGTRIPANASAMEHARERESLGLAPARSRRAAGGRTRPRPAWRGRRANRARPLPRRVRRARHREIFPTALGRDPLTGPPEPRGFHARLDAEVARARRYRGPLAVVLFDLDRFKETNDREGHPEGDRLLRAFATALEGTARKTDCWGGWAGTSSRALLLEVESGPRDVVPRPPPRAPGRRPLGQRRRRLPPDGGPSPSSSSSLADRRLYEDKAARAA